MNAINKNVRSGTDPGHPHDGPVLVHGDSPESPAASDPRTILNVLLDLQHKYGAFGKDSTGHGYNYVSLGRMLDQMRDDLHEAEVLIVHSSAICETVFTLTTRVLHVPSNTEISSQFATPFAEQKANSNAQVTGGYETYGRRYNLMKLLNCSTEDNDAADVYRQAVSDIDGCKTPDEMKKVLKDYHPRFLKMGKKSVWTDLVEYANSLIPEEVDDADPGS